MAGEIEEPIRLDFQPDSVHSGSISFGRFESETLCWERRSSFSHNRYLEEVEKCSKPGSVIEKKAYFEAHFRKKGILSLLSSETQNDIQHQTSKNDIVEKTHCDDNNFVIEYEPQIEHSSDIVDDTGFIPEHSKIEEAANLDKIHVTIGPLFDNLATGQNSDACSKDQCISSPKAKIISESESMKPRLAPRVSVEQRKRYISSKASKNSGQKPSKIVNNVQSKLKAEKKTTEASIKDKAHKSEAGSKAKEVNEIKRAGEKTRNRITAGPQSLALRNVSSRVHQTANRVKPSASPTSESTKLESCRLSSRNDIRAGRRKEFDVKLEKKMHAVHQLKTKTQVKAEAEVRQLRASINFKATPMPSFYRRGSRAEMDTNKEGIGSNVKLGTSTNAIVSSPQQASGVTSCNSTVTSESSPSSPAAAHNHPTTILVNGKKQKANGSLNKHKAPPESNKFRRGKRMA